MSFSTWHNYGYGIDIGELLKFDTVEEVEQILPLCSAELNELWRENSSEAEAIKSDNNYELSDFLGELASMCCLPSFEGVVLRDIILKNYGVEMEVVDDFDGNAGIIYMPSYPWNRTKTDETLTKEKLDAILEESVKSVFGKKAWESLLGEHCGPQELSYENGG